MNRTPQDIAVYTTVHPGTLPYLREWHASILAQTHTEFDLWIGIDQVSSDALRRSVDRPLDAKCIESQSGDTPGLLRERAIKHLVDRYEVVVFVDSDDVVAVDRVERSLGVIADADVACCALDLMDANGRSLGDRFTVPTDREGTVVPISRNWILEGNIVGLGNSVFRTDWLRRCLPIPSGCVAVDWLLADRAWLLGARISFDPQSGGFYRRHADCVTPIRPPFTLAAVLAATQVVLDHHANVCRQSFACVADRKAAFDARVAVVAEFAERIYSSSEVGNAYVCALNAIRTSHTWWSCVAHPALEKTWRRV